MKKICGLVLCGAVVAACTASVSQALPPFKKAFDETYIEPSNNEALKAAFKKASCNACHVKGEGKDVNNAYGEVLADLIQGDAKDRIDAARKAGSKDAEEAKVLQELSAAMKKAEGERSNPSDSASPTYGDRLKSGKLPVDVPE